MHRANGFFRLFVQVKKGTGELKSKINKFTLATTNPIDLVEPDSVACH